jgi:hypothetical protein
VLSWIAVDEQIARHAGNLGGAWRRSHGLATADLVIAATVEVVGGELATSNVRHFPMFAGLEAPYPAPSQLASIVAAGAEARLQSAPESALKAPWVIYRNVARLEKRPGIVPYRLALGWTTAMRRSVHIVQFAPCPSVESAKRVSRSPIPSTASRTGVSE